jgi:hypothetical protein
MQDMLHQTEGEEDEVEEDEVEEDEDMEPTSPSSPQVRRSAFVANSALLVSPVASHHNPIAMALDEEEHSSIADVDGLELEVQDAHESASISETSTQFRSEVDFDAIAIDQTEDKIMEDTVEHQNMEDYGRQSKRRRTEGVAPQRHSSSTTSILATSDPRRRLNGDRPPRPAASSQQAVTGPMDRYLTAQSQSTTNGVIVDTMHIQAQSISAQHESEGESEGENENDTEGENAEEYAVEAVLEHFYDDEGVKYYLVKWEGYEDSHDWLTEEELQGAPEIVAEYNERVRRRKGKQKI